jgi:hypothetical protein
MRHIFLLAILLAGCSDPYEGEKYAEPACYAAGGSWRNHGCDLPCNEQRDRCH